MRYEDLYSKLTTKILPSLQNDIYNHVEPDYLLKVSKSVGSILEEGNRTNNVEGISSLLQSAGCGRLDCLRSSEGIVEAANVLP